MLIYIIFVTGWRGAKVGVHIDSMSSVRTEQQSSEHVRMAADHVGARYML